jgi:acetyl esterase/lipase
MKQPATSTCLSLAALLGLSMLANTSRAAEPAPVDPLVGKVELLWPGGAPGAVGHEASDRPSLTIYQPPTDRAAGTAVVVCPGGGYGHLATGHEGHEIGEWFKARGVTAFVLRYRIAPRYHHPAPISDAQRAIRLVRARAAEWNVKPDHVGIMGFSAGGHLASTAGTHFDDGRPDASDPIERASCRPDFLILCYPVVSLSSEYTHVGSRQNLLGKDADPELVASLSNESQVGPRTPPTFLFHTNADAAVPPENSVLFYLALRKAKVPVELHVYERGAHGVGLAKNDPIVSTWSDRLADWLKLRGLVE